MDASPTPAQTVLAPGRPSAPRQVRVAGRAGRPAAWQRMAQHRWSYAYVAPMFVLFAVFTVYPIFASAGYTLYDWNGVGSPDRYVGLDNYIQVMADPIFWSFKHTFLYAAVLVPVQLTLALVLAVVLNNPRLRGSTFYRAVYFVPTITSAAIVGIVFHLLIGRFGVPVNAVLIDLGVLERHIDWLADPQTVMWVIIGIGIWHTLGYNLVYFLAGLQTIPQELYDSAKLDGAGPVAQLRYVTLPMLRGVGLIILFLAILGSLQVFDLVLVLTGGGPYFASEVVNTYIYHFAFGGFGAQSVQPNVGFASAASFFYGLILLLLTAAQAVAWRYLRRTRRQEATR